MFRRRNLSNSSKGSDDGEAVSAQEDSSGESVDKVRQLVPVTNAFAAKSRPRSSSETKPSTRISAFIKSPLTVSSEKRLPPARGTPKDSIPRTTSWDGGIRDFLGRGLKRENSSGIPSLLSTSPGSMTPSSSSGSGGLKQAATGGLTDIQTEVFGYLTKIVSAHAEEKFDSFPLEPGEITRICSLVSDIFMNEKTLVEVPAPIKIAGDIHGQYPDLARLFKKCGNITKQRYLFLGDYVDRGKQSLETICTLLCYKIMYPDRIYLLRGNHESASVNRIYGFFDECCRRVNPKIWKSFTGVFNRMPIAAIVGGKIFCVHGGISPNLKLISEIDDIKRPTEIPEQGVLSDLLWSDPSSEVETWGENDRGVSYVFGKKALARFMKKNNLDLVCRAHMVVADGYQFFAKRSLVTVFSAPNYCGQFDNVGGVMDVQADLTCSFVILEARNKRY